MAQGVSARENCPKDILVMLLNGGKNFEQIVSSFEGKYSRGTINKYLNELYEKKKIRREGRRGPYVLTPKGEKEARKYRARQNMIDDFEGGLRAKFQAGIVWLQEFDRDFEHFRNMLKIAADGELSESEIKLLIKWGEARLIKEHKRALEEVKQIYSKMKYHIVITWPEKPDEKIDIDKETMDSHKLIIEEMEEVLPKIKRFVESGEFKNATSRERFFKEEIEEGWIPDYKKYLNEFIAHELEKMKKMGLL